MLRLAEVLETAPRNAADLKRAIRANLVAWSGQHPTDQPPAAPARTHFVAFSPDGRTAVTLSPERDGPTWDAVTGEPCGEPLRHAGERHSTPPSAPTAGWWSPAAWIAQPDSGKSRPAGQWENCWATADRFVASPSASTAGCS